MALGGVFDFWRQNSGTHLGQLSWRQPNGQCGAIVSWTLGVACFDTNIL